MHISFSDILSQIADGGWGRDFKDSDEAAKNIMNDRQTLTAFAGVELLRRMNAIARAAGPSESKSHRPKISESDAVCLPDVSVGDHLYEYDEDSGILEFIVIAKDEKNRCMIVRMNDFDLQYGPTLRLADSDARKTKKEAIEDGARRFLKWNEKGVEFFRKALTVANDGGDMSEFENGQPEVDDE